MRDESDDYQAYLVRLWRVLYQGRWQWRASIDSPHTGERRKFGSLAGLFSFFEGKTRQEGTRGASFPGGTYDGGAVPREEESNDV